MIITKEMLVDIMPRCRGVAAEFVGPLNEACERFVINTPGRLPKFLAQIAHESCQLTQLRENLNYSAEALLNIFPRHFTAPEAVEYARNPVKIANRIYASRMGNGDEASGDGWRYRGAGLIQVTGRTNYRACSKAITGAERFFEDDPEQLTVPKYACMSAGWYWDSHGLNDLADRDGFEEITRKINGGLNGQADRVAFLEEAEKALA